MSDIDEKFRPVTAGDVTDEKLLVGEFRAFRRETRDTLESIVRALQTLARIEKRLDVVQDTLNDHEARLDALEKARRPKKRARKK